MENKFENNMGEIQWIFKDTHIEVTEVRLRTRRQSLIPYSAILYFSTEVSKDRSNDDSSVDIYLKNGQDLELTLDISRFREDEIGKIRSILTEKLFPTDSQLGIG